MKRRRILAGLGAGTAAFAARGCLTDPAKAAEGGRPALDPALPQGTREEAALDALPGKRPLVKLTYRPPNYETPLEAFRTAVTPNDRFFVRYHLAAIPELEELRGWRLRVGGEAAGRSFELTLDELRRDFPAAEVAAVCQCSGNRRGLFQPHVPGVQWGVGAMGNARWTGARLRDILARAGVKAGALELAMDGADGPVVPDTPDFIKSIPVEKALHEDTLVAYAMNGEPLPHLNGFPARVVVPGWTATYWVKHVASLALRATPEENFWMKGAYRVPRGLFPTDLPFRSQQAEASEPITQILTNSLIASPRDGDHVPASAGGFEVEGVAWDGGHGIRAVEVSTDGGRSWRPARLGEDLGRYAFRAWRSRVQPAGPGEVRIMARATNNAGQTQQERLVPNPAGYHHTVVQTLTVTVA